MPSQPPDEFFANLSSSRREFLRAAAALGALGAVPALSACGSSSSGPSSGTTGTPQKGGAIKFGMIDFNSTDTLDPAQTISSFTFLIAGNVFEPLTNVDDQYNAQPGLAASWDSNTDASVWTFKLRSGVTFQNGQPLTAQDVIYSFQRQFDPDTGATFVSVIDGIVDPKAIKAVDTNTVQFTLARPHAYFPAVAALNAFAIVPNGLTDFTKPPGTGPFKVQDYTTGVQANLVRNPDYWGSAPHLDSVRVVRFPDPATKVQSVISGDLDLIDAIEYTAMSTVQGASAVKTVVLENSMFMPIDCDMTQEPFTDLRVRQAFKMAVNRDTWKQSVYAGLGSVTPDIPIPPTDQFYPHDLEAFPYDPEKAKSLIAQAGHPDGITINLYTAPTGPGQVEAAVILQQMLGASGINVNVNSQTADVYFSQSFLVKSFVVGWLLREHVSVMLPLIYTGNATIPESKFNNAQFDSLVAQAISSTDLAKSKSLFGDALGIMNEQSGEMIPGHGPKIFVRKNRLQNVQLDLQRIVHLNQLYLTADQ